MEIPMEKIVIIEEKNTSTLNEHTVKKEGKVELLNENMMVGSLVAKKPAYAFFFEKIGIDYCCKGKRTLKELCTEKNLDVVDVLDKLEQISATSPKIDWNIISLSDLMQHIVKKHHDYLREELPRLSAIIHKVAAKHGNIHSTLFELRETFEEFKADLLEHIEKEEKVVFPAIEDRVKNRKHSDLEEGNLKDYLTSLDFEHIEAGAVLEKINKLTDGYKQPAGACTTYLVMLSSLAFLEKDMHEHVHKENHILFSRILEKCY
jgi:regulator of cell morphogenesis and NO signaling